MKYEGFPLSFCINPTYEQFSYKSFCINKYTFDKVNQNDCMNRYCSMCCKEGINAIKWAAKKDQEKFEVVIKNDFILDLVFSESMINRCYKYCKKEYPNKVIIPVKIYTAIPKLGVKFGTNYPALSCQDIYSNNLDRYTDIYYINLYQTLNEELDVFCNNNISEENKSLQGGWMLTMNYFNVSKDQVVEPGCQDKYKARNRKFIPFKITKPKGRNSKKPSPYVTFSKSCNFDKNNVNVNVGDYDNVKKASISEKDHPALKIPKDLMVILYPSGGFEGKPKIFKGPKIIKCVFDMGFTADIKSLKVVQIKKNYRFNSIDLLQSRYYFLQKTKSSQFRIITNKLNYYHRKNNEKLFVENKVIHNPLKIDKINDALFERPMKCFKDFEFKITRNELKDPFPGRWEDEPFFGLENRHVDLMNFEFYTNNKPQDIMFMCTMFREKTDKEIAREVKEINSFHKEENLDLDLKDDLLLSQIKKYKAISFLAFSTTRRARGNFDSSPSLIETLITGDQSLLDPEDFKDFATWNPLDFKHLDFIQFPKSLIINRMLEDTEGERFMTGSKKDAGYTGDPFYKAGSYYWTVNRSKEVADEMQIPDTEGIFNCDNNLDAAEKGKYFSLHQVFVRDRKISLDDANARFEMWKLASEQEYARS